MHSIYVSNYPSPCINTTKPKILCFLFLSKTTQIFICFTLFLFFKYIYTTLMFTLKTDVNRHWFQPQFSTVNRQPKCKVVWELSNSLNEPLSVLEVGHHHMYIWVKPTQVTLNNLYFEYMTSSQYSNLLRILAYPVSSAAQLLWPLSRSCVAAVLLMLSCCSAGTPCSSSDSFQLVSQLELYENHIHISTAIH